ncbi:hypothetical protein ACFL27_20710, partial [candidate division CSSED10-310 bacterium]
MRKLKIFIRTSLLGGLSVILPITILIFVFTWVFNLVTDIIQPITNFVMAKSALREIIADVLVIITILS